jgi:aryl carrier-like protein
MYIPCAYMPANASEKLDRIALKSLTSDLSQDQLTMYSLSSTEKRAPETDMERNLQLMWSQLLRVPPDQIGRDDSFLRIGGDSILAIQLASMAQEQGIRITVANIFKDSRLSALANAAANGAEYAATEVKPFRMLPSEVSATDVSVEIQKQGGLPNLPELEDAFPTYSYQNSMMDLTHKLAGAYVTKRVWRLPSHVDVQRFKDAWDRTVQYFPNLRTRILLVDGSEIQAVVKGKQDWEDSKGLGVRDFIHESGIAFNMGRGSCLSRYAIIEEAGETFFVWIQHHTIMDGWSLNMLLAGVHAMYHGTMPAPINSFANFVQYANGIDQDAAASYWKNTLEGVKQVTWPKPITSETRLRGVTDTKTRTIRIPESLDSSLTLGTVVLGAWGFALRHFDNKDDICFTRTSSGRQAPVHGIDTTPGFCTQAVPTRIRFNKDQTILSLLTDLQNQCSESVPFEHFGTKKIAQILPEAAPALLQSSSLIIPQPVRASGTGEETSAASLLAPALDKWAVDDILDGFRLVPLCSNFFLKEDTVDIVSNYNREVISSTEIETLYDYLEAIIVGICSHSDLTVGNLLERLNLE